MRAGVLRAGGLADRDHQSVIMSPNNIFASQDHKRNCHRTQDPWRRFHTPLRRADSNNTNFGSWSWGSWGRGVRG